MKIFNTKSKISKLLFALILVGFGFLLSLLAPQQARAYSTSEIIPDYVFRSENTMTEQQIQDFLVSHNSFLATYKVPAGYTATYWVGTKQISSYINEYIGPVGQEVSAKDWPVSRVIYNAAKWYHVNPQVIISVLQKESSLAADSNTVDWLAPERFARVAWSMGYGYTESADPIVNVCDTATNHNSTGSCAGIAMQIDWAVGALDSWYNRSIAGTLICNEQPCWLGQTPIIDGIPTRIGNYITGPFYRYTPHLTWGGNFTWCMNNWFPFDFKYVFDVTKSLYLTNINPYEGETVTATYDVKNISDTAFTVNLTIVDYAIDAKNWNSFPYQAVTINPGQTVTYNVSRIAKYSGLHRMELAFGYNGGAYNLISSANNLTKFSYYTKTLPSAFTVTNGLWLSNVNPLVGDSVNGYYQVKNNTGSSLTIDLSLVDYAVDAKTWNSFTLKTVTIPANSTANFTGTHTITGAGLHHTWLAFLYNGTAYNFNSATGQLMDFWYGAR